MATATEANKERSDDAILTSELAPATDDKPNSQNAGSASPAVNGDSAASCDEIENKHISDILDDLVISSEVSISGGSDNEASKHDLCKSKDDEKGTSRSAVKKPTAFKSINVNRTFLITKSNTPSATQKPAEKAAPTTGLSASQAPSTSGSAKPRLVAKIGATLVAKSGTGAQSGRPSGAPDGNVVWNKNRPVPPPEPRKLTDEELKKYGIHMASRLQPDDNKGSKSNWADIEDDDEDWLPDTITWKDGTKTAIPEHPTPAPAPTPVPVSQPGQNTKENGAIEKPERPAPTSRSPPVKPHFSVLGSGKGLVLKGAPEKPTLVAKPPAPPNPVKSPWAPLPKIDRASPMAMDLPPQNLPSSRWATKDADISRKRTPPPPKEIAADDFSRTPWRDGPGGAKRELFNSQSGRYEPVSDRRGGPMRSDSQHGRQPALLQRSSQNDSNGPAEPSAAFQTTRTSGDHPLYGRRRGSSNVSGTSTGFMNRSKGLDHGPPPPGHPGPRRESFAHASDGPISPRHSSPGRQFSSSRGQAWQARASPAMTHSQPYHQSQPILQKPPPVEKSPAQEAAVLGNAGTSADQKAYMRQAREAAMKRRIEEEAREEHAKRERIAAKLAALGPPPESKSAKKAAAQQQAQSQQPADKPPAVNPAAASKGSTRPDQPQLEKASAPASTAAKVNGKPQPSLKDGPAKAQSVKEVVEAQQRPPGTGNHGPSWGSNSRQNERHQQPSWAAHSSTKNVWGAPKNNRSLGNGTFDSELSPSEPAPPSNQKMSPGPIGPPIGKRNSTPTVDDGPKRHPPIGPPRPLGRDQPAADGRGLQAEDRVEQRSAWATAVQNGDAEWRRILSTDAGARDKKLHEVGYTIHEAQPVIKDTWRPTCSQGGVRIEDDKRHRTVLGQSNPWTEGASQAKKTSSDGASEQKSPVVPTSSSLDEQGQQASARISRAPDAAAAPLGRLPSTASSQQGRSSRFFPARDVRLEKAQRHNKSPSPPPPDMAGHPAYDGDDTHPRVTLPKSRPVVKLPPAPATAAGFAWASPIPYKEAAKSGPAHFAQTRQHGEQPPPPNKSWQARINDLLGVQRAHSPPRSGAGHAAQGTWEKPFPSNLRWRTGDSPTSKDMAEECFEEQEMGSLPVIKLPKKASELLLHPAPAVKDALPKHFWIEPFSLEAITFAPIVSGAGYVCRIHLPYQDAKDFKNVIIPFSKARAGTPRQERGGPRQRSSFGRHPSQGQRGGKAWDVSNHANEANAATSSSGGPPRRNGGRNNGGYQRGGSNHWTSRHNSSAPIQT